MTAAPILSRRRLGLAAALLAAPALLRGGEALAQERGAARATLRVGNQKGGLRSLLEASQGAESPAYDIAWSEFPAAAPLLEALSADALDTGTMGDLAFLSVFAAGAPLRAYAATRAEPRSQAILVNGASKARGIADLRGKKLAGNRGGWGHFLLRAALKRAGVAPEEVELVWLGPADAALAFRSGAVDAWAIWEPYVAIEQAVFGARVLEDGSGLTPTVSFLAAHESALRRRRPLLADLARRQRQGWDWAAAHLDAYAAANARLTRLPEAAVGRAFANQRTRAVPLDAALVAELQAAADAALEFGLLRQRLEVARAIDTEVGEG